MTDIFAARLDDAGHVVGGVSLPVAQAQYSQVQPHVAWNGENYLVSWMTQRATDRFHTDILAARVSPAGRVLDASPIMVATANTNDTGANWDLASDGSNWLAVYRGVDSTRGIFTVKGTRISAAGQVLDPAGRDLRHDTINSYPISADVAFAGDEYLMTWVESGTRLAAARFGADLQPIGPVRTLVAPVPVTEVGEQPMSPRVATDGNDFFVTWVNNASPWPSVVEGLRVAHDGSARDASPIVVVSESPGTFRLDAAWDAAASNWVVALNRQTTPDDNDIYAARVSADGVPLDAAAPRPVRVAAGSQDNPAIAPGSTAGGGVRLVWVDNIAGAGPTPVPDPQDIYTASLSASGVAGAASAVSLSAPRQTKPRLAAGANGFLAVFRSETSGEAKILAQRLDTAGHPLDVAPIELASEPVTIASGEALINNPAVAWNGSEYLVVWERTAGRGQIFARRLSAAGAPLEAQPIAVMGGHGPDVAALGTSFLIADAEAPTDPHFQYAQAVRVSADGQAAGAAVRLGQGFDVAPRVGALGRRWLVAWEQNATHDNPTSGIKAAFVNADGTPADAPGGFVVAASGDTAAVAVAGDAALLTWATLGVNNSINGRILHADGSLDGTAAGTAISNATGRKFSPSAAWDGTQYWVDWLDQSNDVYPVQPEGDVFTARVGGAGNVIDPGGFALAATAQPEDMPTVVAADGQAIHAYSVFTPAAPYASSRIALRRTPFAGTGPAFVVAGAFTDRAAPPSLTFVFSEDVAGNVSADSLTLVDLTTGQTVPRENVHVTYEPASRTATFTFPGYPHGILPDGNYEATIVPPPAPAPALAPAAGAASATTPPPFTIRFFVLSGDANHDGKVNSIDLALLRRNYSRRGEVTVAQGDFNYDGRVDAIDLAIWRRQYGKRLSLFA